MNKIKFHLNPFKATLAQKDRADLKELRFEILIKILLIVSTESIWTADL